MMPRFTKLLLLAAFPALLLPAVAQASAAADEFSQCLTGATTGNDRIALTRWIFMGMALHPELSKLSVVSSEQRDAGNKATAVLMERLLTVDCKKQYVAAVKAEGPAVIESSFNILGQVAMRELMTNKDVEKGMVEFARHVDQGKLQSLLLESSKK